MTTTSDARKRRAEAQAAAPPTIPLPFLAHFEDKDDLYAYLARLNEDGHHPELASIDANGVGFLATLTDPDADRVHHVVTAESGFAHHCDEWCIGNMFAPCSWRPKYPVVALSQQSPATVKREIAKASREEAAAHSARIAAARAALRSTDGAS